MEALASADMAVRDIAGVVLIFALLRVVLARGTKLDNEVKSYLNSGEF